MYAKSWEFVNTKGGTGDARGDGNVYGGVITKENGLEMKRKEGITKSGRDVLCICVSGLGMYY